LLLESGAQLGRYRIIAPLGGGGMGEVYRARDTSLERDVALKIISEKAAAGPDAARRFAREAQAASALNHPNIVTVFDVGACESGPFLVMELVAGQTLRALLTRQPGAEDVTAIGRQIARALAVAHGAGIVHRDIKPENVMVRSDGYVKVLDFGLARVAPRTAGPSATTIVAADPHSLHTGDTVMGTAAYLSPEQVRGEPVTSATDVFALGLVFYELATGQHPFAAGSMLGVIARMVSETPVPPSRVNPALPGAIDALILRMLDKDPHQRPDAAEVDRTLAEAVEGGGATAVRVPGRIATAPTVGRDASHRQLVRAFEETCRGRGGVVALSGEPGIGKTTLAEDFIRHAAAGEPCVIARGRCSERHVGGGAYLPWLEALESMRDRSGSVAARLMKPVAPTWYAQIAPLAVDDSPEARAITVNRAGSQQFLMRELAAFVEEVARHAPLILFFDDVHWADESTVDLLAYLAARLESLRVLVIVTYRPSELMMARHPFRALMLDLVSRGIGREVPLDFLTAADVASFLALEFPGHAFPPRLAGLIHGKTEGNPLFMVDLLRSLRDRGVIERQGDTWVLTQPITSFEKDIPASVRSMIELKLARLDDEERRLLIAASVQGAEFDSAVVARAVNIDQGIVEERLDGIERLHAVARQIGETELPDRTLAVRYRFVHLLYQNALYGSLGPSRRASSSAAVARALLAFHGDQSQAIDEQLAYLFEAARDFSRAADHYLRASTHARQIFADREALRLARRGLAMLSALPDTPDRASREVAHLMAVALPMHGVYGYAAPELEETYRRARALCDALGEHPGLFGVITGISAFRFMRAELRPCVVAGLQMTRVAEQSGDPAMHIWAKWAVGSVLAHLGERLPEALETLDQGAALYSPAMHPGFMLMTGFDAGLGCHVQAARVACMLGDADAAVGRIERAVAQARARQHPLMVAFALYFQAWVHQLRREPGPTLRAANEAIAIGEPYGYPHVTAWARVLRGWALGETDDPAAGELEIGGAMDTLELLGLKLMRPTFLELLAEAQLRQGRSAAARATLEQATALVEQTEERCNLPQLLALQRGLRA
jgi:hypothetical protein